MRTKWTGDQLKEAIRRHNLIAAGMKKTLPLVRKELDGVRITAKGVDKKTRKKIDAIIKALMPREYWARCYLMTEYSYNLYLYADFYAPCGDHACNYAELSRSVAIKDVDTWRAQGQDAAPVTTLNKVNNAVKRAEKAEDDKTKATFRASDAKIAAAPFVE